MPIVYAQEGNADAESVQIGIVDARARLMTAIEGIGQGTDKETVLNALSVIEEVCDFLNALGNEADELFKTTLQSVQLLDSLYKTVDDYVKEQLDKDSSFLKVFGFNERGEQETFCRRAVVNAILIEAENDGRFERDLKSFIKHHRAYAEDRCKHTEKATLPDGGE